jgi:hypothetical protein
VTVHRGHDRTEKLVPPREQFVDVANHLGLLVGGQLGNDAQVRATGEKPARAGEHDGAGLLTSQLLLRRQ